MKKGYIRAGLALALGAALFLAAGCGKPSVKVVTAELKEEPLTIEDQIRPEALHTAPVIPAVTGKIVSGPPDVGTVVKAGEVLFTIDDSKYRKQMADIESRLSAASAPAPSYGAPAAAQDMGAEDALLAQGIITRAEYNRILMKRSVPQTAAAPQASAGDMSPEGLLAALQAAQQAISSSQVTAPIDGVVSQLYIDDKRMAVTGHPALVIREDSPVIGEVTVLTKVSDALIRAKEAKTLTVSMTDGKSTWYGELKPQPVKEGSALRLFRIQFDNPEGQIVIGQNYKVRLETRENAKVFVIPKTAFLKPNTLFVVTADGLLDMKTVTSVSTSGDNAFVADGLDEGDRVVTNPTEDLQMGMAVSVK